MSYNSAAAAIQQYSYPLTFGPGSHVFFFFFFFVRSKQELKFLRKSSHYTDDNLMYSFMTDTF